MKNRILITAALTWMLLIWALSSLPSNKIPSVKIFSIDKLAHIGIYLIWGLIVNLNLRRSNASSRTVLFVYVMMVLNAALDEYHQRYIPGRGVSWFDLIANLAGLSLALGHYLWSKKRTHD